MPVTLRPAKGIWTRSRRCAMAQNLAARTGSATTRRGTAVWSPPSTTPTRTPGSFGNIFNSSERTAVLRPHTADPRSGPRPAAPRALGHDHEVAVVSRSHAVPALSSPSCSPYPTTQATPRLITRSGRRRITRLGTNMQRRGARHSTRPVRLCRTIRRLWRPNQIQKRKQLSA